MMTLAKTIKCIAGCHAALALGALSASSHAKNPEPAQDTVCTIDGFTNNAFGKDIVVRSAPSETAPVVGHMPLTTGAVVTRSGDSLYSMRFNIVASRNGWLRLANISDSYNDGETNRAAAIEGKSGWVPANAVRFQIQSARGYVDPHVAADRLFDMKDDWATDAGIIENVLGCNGLWAQVDLRIKDTHPHDRRHIAPGQDELSVKGAWFHGICGSQETTCDMASVDIGD